MTWNSAAPFLGVGAGNMTGPATVKFRVRSANGGAGKVEWLPTPQAVVEAKSVPFEFTGGDWREVSVQIPAKGPLGIVRLYLPATKEPVQLDRVEFKPAKGQARTWSF